VIFTDSTLPLPFQMDQRVLHGSGAIWDYEPSRLCTEALARVFALRRLRWRAGRAGGCRAAHGGRRRDCQEHIRQIATCQISPSEISHMIGATKIAIKIAPAWRDRLYLFGRNNHERPAKGVTSSDIRTVLRHTVFRDPSRRGTAASAGGSPKTPKTPKRRRWEDVSRPPRRGGGGRQPAAATRSPRVRISR
jgi:hypothetical protein